MFCSGCCPAFSILHTQTIAALWPTIGPPCSTPYLSPQADFLDITQFCCLYLHMHNVFLDQLGKMDRFYSVFTLPGACFHSSTVVVEGRCMGWLGPTHGKPEYIPLNRNTCLSQLRQTSIRNVLVMITDPKRICLLELIERRVDPGSVLAD